MILFLILRGTEGRGHTYILQKYLKLIHERIQKKFFKGGRGDPKKYLFAGAPEAFSVMDLNFPSRTLLYKLTTLLYIDFITYALNP